MSLLVLRLMRFAVYWRVLKFSILIFLLFHDSILHFRSSSVMDFKKHSHIFFSRSIWVTCRLWTAEGKDMAIGQALCPYKVGSEVVRTACAAYDISETNYPRASWGFSVNDSPCKSSAISNKSTCPRPCSSHSVRRERGLFAVSWERLLWRSSPGQPQYTRW